MTKRKLHLGVAWYPEHWPKQRWPEDVRLMKQVNMTFVRMGEFAWADLEPSEGEFAFDWLDEAIALAADAGLDVVLGTPTAAPPAWLTQNFPETVAVMENGRATEHGGRCHFDFCSPRYINFCARIAGRMAQRWGSDRRVMGWQIDNEYTTLSFSRTVREQFQHWLRGEYEDLDALNRAWSTGYWSQKYFAWSQIPLPAANSAGEGQAHNPGLRFAFKKFFTFAYAQYQRAQIDAIRAHADTRQFITHNFVMMRSYDHFKLARDLDFACWDYYFPHQHPDWRTAGFELDLARGWKRKPFWVMETQPGSINWASVNFSHRKGETRALAWNVIAHGGDAVSYWQWRMALNGQEQYHGSLLHQDGTPRPIYDEIARFGRELAQAQNILHGEIKNEAALLYSYEDRWAIDFQRHHKDFDLEQFYLDHYKALASQNIALDVVNTRDTLGQFDYKLIVGAPHVMDEGIAAQLKEFVQRGGTLVLLPRAGMKDNDNALIQQRQPAYVQAWAGTQVEEYFALDAPVDILGEGLFAKLLPKSKAAQAQGHIWGEWLAQAKGARVLARYGKFNGWLDGQPAITLNTFGKGQVLYIGCWLMEHTRAKVLAWAAKQAGIKPVLPNLPAGAHAMQRGQATILLAGEKAISIKLPGQMKNALTGKISASLRLQPFDVAVLSKAK